MAKLLSVNLLQRIVVALVGIPLLLWLIEVGGIWFFLFFLLLALLAAFEFHRLARHKAKPPALWIVLAVTALFQLNFYMHLLEVWELLLAVVLALLVMELFLKDGSPLLNLGAIFPGLLYVNLSFGSLLRLRLEVGDGNGVTMVFLLFFCVWAADIFAYFGGSTLGGRFIHRKLFERLSPHKTWEGFLSGLAGSVAAPARGQCKSTLAERWLWRLGPSQTQTGWPKWTPWQSGSVAARRRCLAGGPTAPPLAGWPTSPNAPRR